MKYGDWQRYYQGNLPNQFPTLVADAPMKVYFASSIWTGGYLNWCVITADGKQFPFGVNTKFRDYGAYSPNESFELNKGDRVEFVSANNGSYGQSNYSVYYAKAL